MILAIISITFVLFLLGLTIRNEFRELRACIEDTPIIDNDELRKISTALTEISSNLKWIADDKVNRP